MPAHSGHRPSLVARSRPQVLDQVRRKELRNRAWRVRANEVGQIRVIGVDGRLRLAGAFEPGGKPVHRIVIRLELWLRQSIGGDGHAGKCSTSARGGPTAGIHPAASYDIPLVYPN